MQRILLLTALLLASFGLRADDEGDYLYMHIFGGVIALPSECYFDVASIGTDASFVCDRGRVVVGKYSSLKEEFVTYVDSNLIEKRERCGLSVQTFGEDGAYPVFVHDGREFLVSSAPSQYLEQALEVFCQLKKKSISALEPDRGYASRSSAAQLGR